MQTAATGAKLRSLPEALEFKAPEVVLLFKRQFRHSQSECEILFRETKRWLWACAKRLDDEQNNKKVPGPLLISPELIPIDQMWHCFLLFTKEYENFCQNYLGRFIHHTPLSDLEIRATENLIKTNPEKLRLQRKAEVQPQLEYLYEILGAQAIKLWYQEIPKKFGKACENRSSAPPEFDGQRNESLDDVSWAKGHFDFP